MVSTNYFKTGISSLLQTLNMILSLKKTELSKNFCLRFPNNHKLGLSLCSDNRTEDSNFKIMNIFSWSRPTASKQPEFVKLNPCENFEKSELTRNEAQRC